MKILLDVKDEKVPFLMTLLQNFSFVKTKQLTGEKALFLEELKESVDELSEIKSGKKKARNATDFLKEL